MHSNHPTLVDLVVRGELSLIRKVMLAVGGSLLLWASAKLQVPFHPVPMTMQTFVVLMIGTAYGWRLGAATIFLYLMQGALGMPVFAGTPEMGIGLAYMIGPTGGYLIGYLAAAIATGMLAGLGWDRRASTVVLSMVIGNVLIYVFGLTWLGIVVGWDKPVLSWGLTPFIPGDVLKLILAAVILPLTWRLVDGRCRD